MLHFGHLPGLFILNPSHPLFPTAGETPCVASPPARHGGRGGSGPGPPGPRGARSTPSQDSPNCLRPLSHVPGARSLPRARPRPLRSPLPAGGGSRPGPRHSEPHSEPRQPASRSLWRPRSDFLRPAPPEGVSRKARGVGFPRHEPRSVCRRVPEPWGAPALCSHGHGHGVRRCSKKTKPTPACWSPAEPLVSALRPCPVWRASGDRWGGSTGSHGTRLQGQPPAALGGRGAEAEGVAPPAPGSTCQHPAGRSSCILQHLEPAMRAEEGRARPTPRGRAPHPGHHTSPLLPQAGLSPLADRQLGWAEEAQEAGCVSERAPGEPAPASARSGGPGEPTQLSVAVGPGPARQDGGRSTDPGGQVTAGSFRPVPESVSERPPSCFRWRPPPCTHCLPTRGTATRGSKSTPRAPGHSLLPRSASPAPPPREVPAEAGPRDGEWTQDRAQGRAAAGSAGRARSEAPSALGPRAPDGPGPRTEEEGAVARSSPKFKERRKAVGVDPAP